jgi:hypothetical protein
MKKKIEQMIESLDLILDMKIIDLQYKFAKVEMRQITDNSLFTAEEKIKQLEITYNTYRNE